MSGKFNCECCQVTFSDVNNFRLHSKTDWHVFNIKRKLVDLPPFDPEEFKAAVERARELLCQVCNEGFGDEDALKRHNKSRAHRRNLKSIKGYVKTTDIDKRNDGENKESPTDPSDNEVEEVDSDEWDEDQPNLSDNDCLFCKHHSASLTKNLNHMAVAHTFFIPDAEYCIDVKGLVNYLGMKINTYYMCLWCNEKGRSFYSADAARQHMLDKGHTKMLYEGITLSEYVEYYDYSSSYPDATEANEDEEVRDPPVLDGDDYELTLPSGIVVGHRSLMRYYRQNIDPKKAVVPVNNSKRLHKVLAQYKALGWSTTHQDIAAKRARDMHVLKRQYAKLTLSLKANRFQKHYRPQVNF